MTFTMIVVLVLVVFFVLIFGVVAHKRVPRRLKSDKFSAEWKDLQGLCKDKSTWPDAIMRADALFDAALKKRRFKGKRMGERMVAAQRKINNNDQLWFAHNLAKKIIADPKVRLKEQDVKAALIGFRQALKDIGALKPIEKPIVEQVAEQAEAKK